MALRRCGRAPARGYAQARGGEWTTTAGDAQRTAWVRADARLTQGRRSRKGEFKFLWKMKFDNEARQWHSLTEPVLLDRLIGYRGFKALALRRRQRRSAVRHRHGSRRPVLDHALDLLRRPRAVSRRARGTVRAASWPRRAVARRLRRRRSAAGAAAAAARKARSANRARARRFWPSAGPAATAPRGPPTARCRAAASRSAACWRRCPSAASTRST